MTAAEACLKLVEELPVSVAQYLIQQLRCGIIPAVPNPTYQGRVDQFLRDLAHARGELAPMLEVALAAKHAMPTTELVWTGPSTSVVPGRSTEQVLFEMVQGACRRFTIMSFGVFRVPRLVQVLEAALARDIQVRIVLGDRDSQGNTEFDHQRHQLGGVVAARASLLQWCRQRRPRDEHGHAGLMHAKAAVADSCVAFLTSANLTEAAFERDMELGILIRGGHVPAAVERLIEVLIESGELQPA